MNVLLGFLLEAVFVLFPMTCMAAVLYDISLNGMHSVFSTLGLGILSTWAAFGIMVFGIGKLDDLIDKYRQLRRRRASQPCSRLQNTVYFPPRRAEFRRIAKTIIMR